MADSNLADQLGLLSASQLATITYEAGVTADDGIPGYGGLTSTGTYWSYVGANPHTWQTALGTGVTGITYAFGIANDKTTLSPAIQSDTAQALALWSDIANINFTYTTDVKNASVVFVQSNETYGEATKGTGTLYTLVSSIPTTTPGLDQETRGQVLLDVTGTFGDPGSYTALDGYGVSALVHEAGHLLGLGHTGPYNQGPGGAIDWASYENNSTDVKTWSIMSYIDPLEPQDKYYTSFDPTGTDWRSPGEPLNSINGEVETPFTPMGLDIFAAQRLYGAPTNGVLSGGQTFGFHSNIMYTDVDGTQQTLSMYDFNQDKLPVVTLYDYGTNNTLDLSGFSAASSVNLNPGTWTSAAGLTNNVFIEYGTQIDTAVGGSGNDKFTLNTDGDFVDGGGGTNTATLSGIRAAYTPDVTGNVTTMTDIATGAVNTLTNIQSVSFSDVTVNTTDLMTVTWTGLASDDLYNDAGNWNPGVVPAFDNNVVIGNGVSVFVTDNENLVTLDLGTFLAPGSPLPTVNVDGGTLAVSENIVGTDTGIYPDPIGVQTVAGGGTIALDSGGTLQIGGTTDAAITVDFGDNDGNVLQLGAVNAATPGAFAGTITGFTQGDTILVSGVDPDATVADSYDPISHMLIVTDIGVPVAQFAVVGSTPLVSGDFVLNSVNGALSIGEEPAASFGWDFTVAQLEDDWSTSGDWVQLPVTGTQVTRIVPRSVDSAYVVGGVEPWVTTAQTVALLGLGGLVSPGAPVPTIDVNGGTLDVTGAVLGSFSGAFVAGLPSVSFAGGGTIDLHNSGKLEIGGTANAAITVDFANLAANVLQLDDVNSGAPNAFGGVITGFTLGDTITLSRVLADASDAVTYDSGTLTVTEDGLTIATLNVTGTYSSFNLAVAGNANGGTDITETPGYAWIPEVSGLTPSSTSWNDPNVWEALPATATPVTGVIPGAGTDAFIVGGTDAAIIYFGGPETVATLGLGIGTTPDVVLPIVDVQGGSLLVTANVLDGWSGVFPGSATSQTFYGGGTIALDYGGSLEVDGSVAAGITIDMRGNYTNKLVLDGVSSGATNAFAGMIVDFTQGDTITLGNVQADTATYNAGVLTLMTGGQVDAKLDVAGTVGANLVLGNFIVTSSASAGTTITEILVPPPPGTTNWKGAPGADFDTAGNWSLNQIPNAANNVAIAAGGTAVAGGGLSNQVDSLQIAAGATLSLASGKITIDDANLASLNNGEIDIAAGTDLLTGGSTVTIGGAGTIVMTQGTLGGRSVSSPPDTLFVSGDVEGSGVIGAPANPLIFVNDGVVEADSGTLTLDGTVSNGGTLESDSSGLLVITGTVVNIMPPAGGPGVVEAFSGGTVQLDNATIVDGDVTADSGGTTEVTGNVTLDGIAGATIGGNVVLDKGATLTLTGNVSGAGAEIDSTQGQLIVAKGAALSGIDWTPGSNVELGGGGTFYGPIDLSGLTIGSGATETVAPPLATPWDGDLVQVSTGETLTLQGTLIIEGNSGILGDGDVTMTTGAVLAGYAFNNPPGLPAPGTSPTEPYDNLVLFGTIEGAGVITGFDLANVVTSSILANDGTLIIDSGPDYVEQGGTYHPEETVSDGVLGATESGDLVIMGTLDLRPNIIDGSSPGGALSGAGEITLGGSSAVTGAQSGTLVGGTIAAGMTLQVAMPGGALAGVTNDGGIVVNAGALLTLAGGDYGTVLNAGVITLETAAEFAPEGDVTLTGGGTLQLLGNAGDADFVNPTTLDVLENVGDTIAGYGTVGGTYLNLINYATVDANVLARNLFVNGGAGVIENDGLMEASGGGTLVMNGAILNYTQTYDPNYPLFAPGTSNVIGYGAYVPSGGGDIAAIGTHSAVALDFTTIAAGILMTADGGGIYVTGNSTIGGGPDPALSLEAPVALGGPDVVINSATAGQQSDGAAAGLIGNQGRIAVAWVDSSGATPVVRYQVVDQFGVKHFAGDMADPAAAGASQSDPKVAALPNGGFAITWLETSGGATTLRAATFTSDLSVANSAIAITLPLGASSQNVATLTKGGFVVVWADAAAAGVASMIHLQGFSPAGVPGVVVDLGLGIAPSIAVSADGSGAYAVAWATGGADSSVSVQAFTASGVAGAVSIVPASIDIPGNPPNPPSSVAPGDAPFIVPGEGGFIVFWNDPANGMQAAGYASNGTEVPVYVEGYLGLYTASSAVLPDGRVATVQNIPDTSTPVSTDIGLQFAAPLAVSNALVSYANVVVKQGITLTLTRGMYNDGLIALSASGGAALAVSGYDYVDGPGAITLGDSSDSIVGATGADTLINEGNTIQGQGAIGGDNLSFNNQGTVDANNYGTLTVDDGTGTLTNLGLMEATTGFLAIAGSIVNEGTIATAGGTVGVEGAVTNPFGYFAVLNIDGGKMYLDGAVDASENIYFSTSNDTPGTLVLNDPAQMNASIIDLNLGDTIDVVGKVATSFIYQGDTLYLMSGAATVASFDLNYVSPLGGLTLAPDGEGGTLVEDVPSQLIDTGTSPSLAALPDGGFVAVYEASPGIFARIYDAKAHAVSQAITIDTAGTQPVIAVQDNGQFLVAWSNASTNTIQGAIYDSAGDLVKAAFDLTTVTGGDKDMDPSISAEPGGYLLTYDVEEFKATATFYQAFDIAGNRIGAATAFPEVALNEVGVMVPITQSSSPRVVSVNVQEIVNSGLDMAGANPNGNNSGIGAIITDVSDASGAFLGSTQSGIAVDLPGSPTPDGLTGSDVVTSESGPLTFDKTSSVAGPTTVLLTPMDDGVIRVSPDIAGLSNGDDVGVWDQFAPGDTTWTVAGQIVTPDGQFVGSGFTISTTLPTSATPERPTLNALPNSDFVVTYNDGVSSITGQKFDSAGNTLGGPFAISNASLGNPATTVLSDGTLLTLSGDSGGDINAGTFSVQAAATWTGATGTDLGTAGNWQPAAIPDMTETLTFDAATGGALTGTAAGMNAVFGGTGAWLLQDASLTLAGETLSPTSVLALSEDGNLSVSGGSIAADGSLDIETDTGESMTVLSGAQISAQGLSLGLTSGQSGLLSISGSGTAILNTGTGASVEIGGGGSGQVAISGGASLSAIASGALPAMALGAIAGGTGTLMVTGAGSLVMLTGQLNVGQAGNGDLAIGGQGTVQTGNDPALDPAEGFDIAQMSGASGTATVTGSRSLLTNSGRFVVGDAAAGSLSILAGGTVATAPGAGSSLPGAVIGNAASAAGSSVDVSGAGSNWQVTGLLDVGVSGSGALSISNGASVAAGSLDAANAASAVANISVTNAIFAVTGDATVADDGTGVLSVLSGATFSAANLTIGSRGDSSGAVVVSGKGSVIDIAGALNVGTALGTGDLTIGPGAVVNAKVVNLRGQVVLENGELDPTVNLINQGETVGGSGTLEAGDIVDEGAIQAGGGKQPLVVSGTVLGGGPWTIDGTAQAAANGGAGVLRINAGATLELTGPVLNASMTTFTDDVTQQSTYTVNNSVVDVNFGDATGVLDLGDIGGFAGTIAAFQTGDSFVVAGGTLSGLGVSNGNTLTVSDSGNGETDKLVFASSVTAGGFSIVNNNTIQVACFAAGTRIGTPEGPVAVEALNAGDRVVTADGRIEPIVWIGQRSVDCTRHPRPETVWPVRVSAGAFGENVPIRNLHLSPDHAVFVSDALIPVKLLVNGTSITQVKRPKVTYYHVELERHEVIVAEGLRVESYLDVGDRANFNNERGMIRLFPDFASRPAPHAAAVWETRGAAPLVVAGEALAHAILAIAANDPDLNSRPARIASPTR